MLDMPRSGMAALRKCPVSPQACPFAVQHSVHTECVGKVRGLALDDLRVQYFTVKIQDVFFEMPIGCCIPSPLLMISGLRTIGLCLCFGAATSQRHVTRQTSALIA